MIGERLSVREQRREIRRMAALREAEDAVDQIFEVVSPADRSPFGLFYSEAQAVGATSSAIRRSRSNLRFSSMHLSSAQSLPRLTLRRSSSSLATEGRKRDAARAALRSTSNFKLRQRRVLIRRERI